MFSKYNATVIKSRQINHFRAAGRSINQGHNHDRWIFLNRIHSKKVTLLHDRDKLANYLLLKREAFLV